MDLRHPVPARVEAGFGLNSTRAVMDDEDCLSSGPGDAVRRLRWQAQGVEQRRRAQQLRGCGRRACGAIWSRRSGCNRPSCSGSRAARRPSRPCSQAACLFRRSGGGGTYPPPTQSRIVAASVGRIDCLTNLCFPSNTTAEIVAYSASNLMYFKLFRGCSFPGASVHCSRQQTQPAPKGAPFHNAWRRHAVGGHVGNLPAIS